MKYPCNQCNKVAQPGCCENKSCTQWRNWFLRRWAFTRSLWGADHDEL